MCYKKRVIIEIKAYGQSDVGRVRSSNEDAWGVFPDLQFFVVADGMGGHAAGEIASRMAVDIMHDFIESSLPSSEVTWPAEIDMNLPLPVRRLVAAGKLANEKIFQSSRAQSKRFAPFSVVEGARMKTSTAPERAFVCRHSPVRFASLVVE